MKFSPEPLEAFARAVFAHTQDLSDELHQQIFNPTGYPAKVTVAPGLRVTSSRAFDYAPDIGSAELKIHALTAAARAGKLAVLNINIEPGSGKTLHLPKRFGAKTSLVVVPSPFDAWIAWSADPLNTGVSIFGFDSPGEHSVVYMDSYRAAHLLLSDSLASDYGIIFIDECDSTVGVVGFLAGVARPGQVFVRMTASPPTVNTRVKKSFPIAVERDVPDYRDLDAAVSYIANREEERVLVLAPTTEAAAVLASRVPGSALFTSDATPQDLFNIATNRGGRIVLVADDASGRGVNLNLDCVIDFGLVGRGGSTRQITASEQLQRKARTGRLRSGVYCCAIDAPFKTLVDDLSVFRSNVVRRIAGVPLYSCKYPEPDLRAAQDLFKSIAGEPALRSSSDPPAPATVVDPAGGSDLDSITSGERDKPGPIYCDLHIDSDSESIPGLDDLNVRDPTEPSWYDYYYKALNHPSVYTSDLVFDHRGMTVAGVQLDRSVTVAKASNRIEADGSEPPSPRRVGSRSAVDSRPPGSPGRAFGRVTSVASRSRDGSVARSIPASQHQYSRGNTGFDVRAYEPVPGIGRRRTTFNAGFEVDNPYSGPVVLLRSSKVTSRSRGTAYKTASVCAGYFVVHGIVLASYDDLHRGLVPLRDDVRQALRDATGAPSAVRADYYLTYTTVVPVGSVDIESKRNALISSSAWAIPSCSELPVVDLETAYHADWEEVLQARVRSRLPLPRFIPRAGSVSRVKYRVGGKSAVAVALDICASNRTYDVGEQATVVAAWDLVSVESCTVGPIDYRLYDDAAELLSYLACADKLVSPEFKGVSQGVRVRSRWA